MPTITVHCHSARVTFTTAADSRRRESKIFDGGSVRRADFIFRRRRHETINQAAAMRPAWRRDLLSRHWFLRIQFKKGKSFGDKIFSVSFVQLFIAPKSAESSSINAILRVLKPVAG